MKWQENYCFGPGGMDDIEGMVASGCWADTIMPYYPNALANTSEISFLGSLSVTSNKYLSLSSGCRFRPSRDSI
ncbi:MAG: hypothetical protein CM1200mP39_21810 [Dehalococcoidia bacterium]|nr:MAG: hypothetical protein CM1200mP39_21810 [Dehalococcoidia bacterium]